MPPLPTIYIFADESGDFDFSNGGSEYFIVCAVTMTGIGVAHRLLDLRHELTLQGHDIEAFHAANDPWPVRTRVFAELQAAQVKVDAVALQKRKTYPRVAADKAYFYQLAWHLLFKHVAPLRCQPTDYLLVAAASLGTAARKTRFKNAVDRVVQQHNVCRSVVVGFWQTATHPCLQVADYCAWALQRWKERGDVRAYNFIQAKVAGCFEPFASNPANYY
jgi:hypothetical protein